MDQKKIPPASLGRLESIAKLMDSQFRIPGSNIRFGLDGIIGLIPGAGDFATLIVSTFLMSAMAKNGASGYVLARMAVNVVIDAIIGAIPFLGDLFDFGFKANTRNIKLMKEHYQEGRHRGSAAKVLVPLLILVFVIVAAIIYGTIKLFEWIF